MLVDMQKMEVILSRFALINGKIDAFGRFSFHLLSILFVTGLTSLSCEYDRDMFVALIFFESLIFRFSEKF